ncbi:hypothetical protein HW132_36410 [Brasilonema sp. CT11]|nr:hypothetical protein [Brasilonema sp. CT11]
MTSKTKNSNRLGADDDNDDYKINITDHNDENKFLSEDFNAGKKKKMIGSHRNSTDSEQPELEYPQWKLIELTHDYCDKQDTIASYVQSPTMVSLTKTRSIRSLKPFRSSLFADFSRIINRY